MSTDERPGDPATLDELYDLVPHAEEIDLRDELALEEQRTHWLGELRPLLDDEPGEPASEDEDEGENEDEPWRLTDGQVLGMIEHVLGAERVDDGADWDH